MSDCIGGTKNRVVYRIGSGPLTTCLPTQLHSHMASGDDDEAGTAYDAAVVGLDIWLDECEVCTHILLLHFGSLMYMLHGFFW